MGTLELLVLAVGLSMDAFAVSICKGLSLQKMRWRYACICGAWFGFFQALMPAIGFFAGAKVVKYVASFDHWLVFILLALIGGNMIRESRQKDIDVNPSFGFVEMLLLAIATSIDALAIGVSLAFLDVNIWSSITLIGLTTFFISGAGVKIGNLFGARYKSKAELAGGIVLILIGLRILISHIIG